MFICMSTQINYKWEHENDVEYMGEVVPASAMQILPVGGLSNPYIRNMKYEIRNMKCEIRNTKCSNYRLWQSDKMYKTI